MRKRQQRARWVAAVIAMLSVGSVTVGCSTSSVVPSDLETPNSAAFAQDTQAQLQEAVEAARDSAGASGAIVGVWAPWSGSWVKAIGTVSPGSSKPVTTDMDFRVGNITRPMTCDVMYSLAAEGTVDINARITDYVTGYPELKDVTVGNLCESTAGLGSYSGSLKPLWITNPARVWDPRELISYGLGQMPAQPPEPGTVWRGSDASYVLLGLVLERVTQREASELLKTYVFDPLGMTGTALQDPTAKSPAITGTALPGFNSVKNEDGVMDCAAPLDVTSLSSSAGFTSAGVASNLEDVRRYTQALAKNALHGSDASRFANPYPFSEKGPTWHGAAGGALLADTLVGQFGSMPGYNTAAYSDSRSGLTIVVVLNNSGGNAWVANDLAWELAAIASKTPATGGASAPDAGLPWTADTYRDKIAKAAVCQPAE